MNLYLKNFFNIFFFINFIIYINWSKIFNWTAKILVFASIPVATILTLTKPSNLSSHVVP